MPKTKGAAAAYHHLLCLTAREWLQMQEKDFTDALGLGYGDALQRVLSSQLSEQEQELAAEHITEHVIDEYELFDELELIIYRVQQAQLYMLPVNDSPFEVDAAARAHSYPMQSVCKCCRKPYVLFSHLDSPFHCSEKCGIEAYSRDVETMEAAYFGGGSSSCRCGGAGACIECNPSMFYRD